MQNEQFNQFMSIFSINQTKSILKLQKEQDVIELENTRNKIIYDKDLEFDEVTTKLRQIITTEELVYKLSNPFMHVGINNELPYEKVMTLPIKKSYTELLILVKTISTLNKLHLYYNLDKPVITQDLLVELGYTLTINQFTKFLDLLGDNRVTTVNDGIEVNLGFMWSQLPLSGPGYIQYDMSNFQDKIDLAQTYLDKIKNGILQASI